MYTLEIIKNLLSGFLLNKHGLFSLMEYICTITKNNIFVKLLCLRLLRMKLKFNLIIRLREFVVIRELNTISVYLMNFINNIDLYMKRQHQILLK